MQEFFFTLFFNRLLHKISQKQHLLCSHNIFTTVVNMRKMDTKYKAISKLFQAVLIREVSILCIDKTRICWLSSSQIKRGIIFLTTTPMFPKNLEFMNIEKYLK